MDRVSIAHEKDGPEPHLHPFSLSPVNSDKAKADKENRVLENETDDKTTDKAKYVEDKTVGKTVENGQILFRARWYRCAPEKYTAESKG